MVFEAIGDDEWVQPGLSRCLVVGVLVAARVGTSGIDIEAAQCLAKCLGLAFSDRNTGNVVKPGDIDIMARKQCAERDFRVDRDVARDQTNPN